MASSCDGPGGNPSFNPILNPNDLKDEFNSTDPVDDVKNYLLRCRKCCNGMATHRTRPRPRAGTLLPDILH